MSAADPNELAQQVAAPLQYAHPAPRELRAQAIKRLQVGLFGLATMLLLVALANIIMERARMADSSVGAGTATHAASNAASATDPLADLGVIPSPDATSSRNHGGGSTNNH